MKSLLSGNKGPTLMAMLVCLVFAIAAPLRANPKPSAVNAAPVELVIAQSVFVLPSGPSEGKDPFYPRSSRPYASFVLTRTNAVAAPAVAVSAELHLNGISGTAARPLAIINNRTFEVGEEGDVYSNIGRARIRCIEIRPDSVIIQIGGERRMLHLRSGI